MRREVFKWLGTYLFIVGICISLITSCSKEDNTPIVTFHYSTDIFEISYQSEGTIPAPTMDWPVEKGIFALKNAINGLVIDSNTGAITIEKSLPVGEHEVVVYAIDNKDTWITNFILDYTLKNAFLKGGQNNNPDSMFDILIDRNLSLYNDGTLTIEIDGEEDSKGVGVWSLEGNNFKMQLCTYCADINPLDIPLYDEHAYYEGTLRYAEDDGASIWGQWYVIRFDPDSTNLRGDFVFVWNRN
ncbi:hypothetical protein GGR42_002033 [Saonia flava]|uniref:Uncharacterized protein n=1 Tax=Saonia flava TaxID=523696 RepID=A0A846QTP4_9FLAO|nr:hypothetical protein [Saonia flava]NJB71571.1 hypothetical protein [Saonia flava]